MPMAWRRPQVLRGHGIVHGVNTERGLQFGVDRARGRHQAASLETSRVGENSRLTSNGTVGAIVVIAGENI